MVESPSVAVRLGGVKLHRNARSALKLAPAREMSRLKSAVLHPDGSLSVHAGLEPAWGLAVLGQDENGFAVLGFAGQKLDGVNPRGAHRQQKVEHCCGNGWNGMGDAIRL
eukprot:7379362-Pyramimonas_sp.AAC.1